MIRSEAMTKFLEDLLAAAKTVVLTPEEKEQQRPIRLLRSAQSLKAGSAHPFAYGNTAIENPRITREMLPPQNAKTGHSGDPGLIAPPMNWAIRINNSRFLDFAG